MNIEIERKFLVTGAYKHLVVKKFEIKQGYISTDKERVVRIRLKNKMGFITIKGLSDNSGMARMEWEKEIPYNEALGLLELCHKPIIEKVRYIVEHGKHIVEVDEFFGENTGLTLAEIELSDMNEKIVLPQWLGKEVTNDSRYYNSNISKHPYTDWANEEIENIPLN
ncbi:MAG: CYTH domain-containing protein [Salinivirgaceae bacterium]|jgi:adenylate cyclase|nr:CYTH domain-containing protein [Salinivirgaceae bacterium]